MLTDTNFTHLLISLYVLTFSQAEHITTSSLFVKLESLLETFFLPLFQCIFPRNLFYFRGIPSWICFISFRGNHWFIGWHKVKLQAQLWNNIRIWSCLPNKCGVMKCLHVKITEHLSNTYQLFISCLCNSESKFYYTCSIVTSKNCGPLSSNVKGQCSLLKNMLWEPPCM